MTILQSEGILGQITPKGGRRGGMAVVQDTRAALDKLVNMIWQSCGGVVQRGRREEWDSGWTEVNAGCVGSEVDADNLRYDFCGVTTK